MRARRRSARTGWKPSEGRKNRRRPVSPDHLCSGPGTCQHLRGDSHGPERKAIVCVSAPIAEEASMNKQAYPPGWDEERVKKVLEHYETQTEEEAVAEDEAAFEDSSVSVMLIPNELVPAVQEIIARHKGEESSNRLL